MTAAEAGAQRPAVDDRTRADAFSRRQVVLSVAAAAVVLGSLAMVGAAYQDRPACRLGEAACGPPAAAWARHVTVVALVAATAVTVVLVLCVHHALRVAAFAFRPDPHTR